LTSESGRAGIEEEIAEKEEWKNVHFYYVDEKLGNRQFHSNRMIARLQSWYHYHQWCRCAAVIAKQLALETPFDLGHHVTYATWRLGSPLAGLGIPWIWGPIGGGETFPFEMLPILSPVARFFELIRRFSTIISRRSSSVKSAARTASIVLPNNPETENLILSLGVKNPRISRLCQSFLPAERLDRLKRTVWTNPRQAEQLRCVAGGNLEGRKGVAIALRALAILDRVGVPFHYTYLGRGPELKHLQELARRLEISDRVQFLNSLSGDEYVNALNSSHVYLLPSLREGVPLTQMEAMAAGCVPIVAACGGAGPMACEAGVSPISIGSPDAMAKSISDMLVQLWDSPQLWQTLSDASASAIRKNYSSEHYLSEINRFYGMATTSVLH
jgi:glycosyltransferase involved in cell wall biosynthesis